MRNARAIILLTIVYSCILLSCNSKTDQRPYSPIRTVNYGPLKIKYTVPANWKLSSKQEFRRIKQNTADSRFLLGIRSPKKGFLYLSDYNLTVDNCNNKQFVDSMRTILMRGSTWSIKYPVLKTELKEPVQKTLGSYTFTVLENDYIFKTTNKTMMSTLFYIGPTINNHVLVGLTNVSDLTELGEVESGFSYSRDTTRMVDLFFSHKKDTQ